MMKQITHTQIRSIHHFLTKKYHYITKVKILTTSGFWGFGVLG